MNINLEQIVVFSWLKRIFKTRNVKRHWYAVRFIYKDKDTNERIFDYTNEMGLKHQRTILNYRSIKKIDPPLHKTKALKKYLRNGILGVEIVAYLGYFRDTQPISKN